MRDLTDPRWMYTKAALLLLGGLLSLAIVLVENPSWRIAALVATSIWCFCRAYYFAFYVIEKYIDPQYRFAGLTSLVRYWLGRR